MINLFPRCRAYFTAGLSIALVIAAAVHSAGLNWGVSLAVFFALVFLVYLADSVYAVTLHQKVLAYLYQLQKPRDFIDGYSLLLKAGPIRANVRFSMLANLSNAYAAAGNYNKALALLEDMPPLKGPAKKKAPGLLAGNRCDIYCAMGDAVRAREEYEKVPEGDSGRWLLRIKLALLEGQASGQDADDVREALKAPASPFYQTNLNFLLGSLYAQLGQPEFARAYLKKAASCPAQMAVSGKAEALLKTL